MDIFKFLYTTLLISVFVIAFLKSVYDHLYSWIHYLFGEEINRHFLFKNLKHKYKLIITKYCNYYNQLNFKNKLLFEKRMQKFIDMKKFEPRGKLKEVTDEMKAMIAATAIQITFGFPAVYFQHFKRILLYDDAYYSKTTKKRHQGEVNMRGAIVLSWSNFVKGFADNADGVNLGFHEMAHALKLENAIINREYDFIDEEAMLEFNEIAKIESEKIKFGEDSFFRAYAAANRQEFFAIVVENFFERREEFQGQHPRLFELTRKILRQE